MKLVKLGGMASLANAGVALANIVIVFGIIGAGAMADPAGAGALVNDHPTALLWLEFLKVLAAATAALVIIGVNVYLRGADERKMKIATFIGVVAVFLLFAAGVSGILGVMQLQNAVAVGQETAGDPSTGALIVRLGMLSVVLNGIWYWLVGRVALAHAKLPKLLCHLGMALGSLSVLSFILPLLLMLVLVLGLPWSVWLGISLLKTG